jgi:hypothetical protein
MTAAEGWSAQRLALPVSWYHEISNGNVGFPISGDATCLYDRDIRGYLTPEKEDH